MALKEKFFAMLSGLDEEEKRFLREALTDPPTEQDESCEAPETSEQTPDTEEPSAKPGAETQAGEVAAEPESEASAEEPEEEIPTFDKAAPEADEAAAEAEEVSAGPEAEAEATLDAEAAPPAEALRDEQGDEMPVDYRQIIDGLNAKIMALEAENAGLKAKTEGAFGLTSKPGEFARVNPLYDDDTSDIHFKK